MTVDAKKYRIKCRKKQDEKIFMRCRGLPYSLLVNWLLKSNRQPLKIRDSIKNPCTIIRGTVHC